MVYWFVLGLQIGLPELVSIMEERELERGTSETARRPEWKLKVKREILTSRTSSALLIFPIARTSVLMLCICETVTCLQPVRSSRFGFRQCCSVHRTQPLYLWVACHCERLKWWHKSLGKTHSHRVHCRGNFIFSTFISVYILQAESACI